MKKRILSTKTFIFKLALVAFGITFFSAMAKVQDLWQNLNHPDSFFSFHSSVQNDFYSIPLLFVCFHPKSQTRKCPIRRVSRAASFTKHNFQKKDSKKTNKLIIFTHFSKRFGEIMFKFRKRRNQSFKYISTCVTLKTIFPLFVTLKIGFLTIWNRI